MSKITFADDMVEELLERTEKGEALTVVCQDPRMPCRRSVYEWIESDQDFAARFRAARARGVHALVEECIAIADAQTNDPVQVANKRVRIDTRLRLAGKWLPKEYGERLDVNYSGEIAHRHDLSRLSADELDALESLVAKGTDDSGDPGRAGASITGSVH